MLGLAAYMFDDKLPLYLRGLSLFHVAVPPVLVFLLYHYGYDPRALVWQVAVTCAAVALAYALTNSEKNINWAFGPGTKPQHALHPLVYLALELAVMILLVLVPTHLLLRKLFPLRPIP